MLPPDLRGCRPRRYPELHEREALRSLKRQLGKVVYRHLVADREHHLALAV